MDDLEQWLERDHARAYRTACLVLADPVGREDGLSEKVTATASDPGARRLHEAWRRLAAEHQPAQPATFDVMQARP